MQDDGRFLLDNSLYCGDARNLLQQVRPDSVDLSFWSPPYYVGKSYERSLSFQDWQHLLEQVILHHFPILKPGGFLVINIADILAFSDPSIPRIQADNVTSKKVRITKEEVLLARQANPHLNRYQLAKLLGCSEQTIDRRLKHNNVRGGKYAAQTRVLPVAGLVDGWASKAGFYLYDRRIWVKDPCWQNSRWHSLSYRSVDEFEYLYFYWKPGITTIDRSRLNSHEWSQWGSRGVWYIPSVRTHEEHEAQFPVELPRRVIRLLSRPSGLVLDCFVGSGTTAVAAIQEGRRYLGFDIVPQNIEQAACRCHQSQVPLSDARP
ncbi:MAG: site-specific DNA-methyltransferase [Chloroflexi bacterium]|nr:site-specific DNA-methyltransferase [Chloroflexota bacterium]